MATRAVALVSHATATMTPTSDLVTTHKRPVLQDSCPTQQGSTTRLTMRSNMRMCQ